MVVEDLQEAVKDLPSYIIADDFIIYHRYLSVLRSGDLVVDLGTGWGKSVCIMALANPDVDIITIDDASYQIYQNWAENQEDYKKKIEAELSKRNIQNVTLIVKSIFDYDVEPIRLLHLDMIQEHELEGLKKWLPYVEKNGIALLRNYERFKDNVGDLLNNFEFIDKSGLIYVFVKK